jgi:hypothetical protein
MILFSTALPEPPRLWSRLKFWRTTTLQPPLSRHRRTFLSLPRSHRSGYLLRKDLHFQKENKSQHFSGGSSRRYQGGRRWHLAGDFYGLRSWLYRSGGKNPAALKQPFWPKSVNYVSGTFCKRSVRTVQLEIGRGDGNRTHVRSTEPAKFPLMRLALFTVTSSI